MTSGFNQGIMRQRIKTSECTGSQDLIEWRLTKGFVTMIALI
jgi:hypothetical protein